VHDNYQEHLVCTHTEDGIRLDGALIRALVPTARPIAVVWVHGGGSNFYQPMYLRLGRALAARRIVFITGNTRGHDYGSWCEHADGTSFLGGVAWERLEGAPRDVAAWVRFAAEQGVHRVALAGHSLGALKVIVYQAEHPDPRVVGLALISPPLRPEWDTGRYPNLLAQAEQLVADGQAEELLPGPWIRLSARTLLSTHRFDLDQFGRARPDAPIARVRCPVLAILGTNEPSIGVPDDLETVRRNARAAPRVELRVLEGADHSYAGQEAELAEVLADWIAGVSNDPSPPS
jgi:pimeloyl-ACP methyl ester carboxylesterase